jgi:ribosomal protein S18 acetylase RimI-like enzyme
MQEIAQRENFLPEATWLALELPPTMTLPVGMAAAEALKFLRQQGLRLTKACGTVQGLVLNQQVGSIQNLGVVASHRGHGLGSALLHQALLGFRERGLSRAILEVTNDNLAAVRLYQRLGWQLDSVHYKAVEIIDRA